MSPKKLSQTDLSVGVFLTLSYGLYSTLLFDPVLKIKLFKVKSI